MKKLLFTLFSLAIIGVACLSCKIGLGEAVDTQPPEVTITKPDVGAVIRDQFIIGGVWSDDGTVKEDGISVTLERTDDSIEPIVYTSGKVGAEDWSCVINPFDTTYPLVDGEYQATITMTDTYEHKTVKTITFTIDNTAPIIVLQRPSAKKGDSKPDSYGQSFTLEGQAADDNNIDSIDVSLYAEEECTTLLHTVHLTNVPPTIELDVAKFAEGVENDYSKIYGSSNIGDGTKQFYCQIVAYDGAQRYPADGSAQTDADKKGNSTDHYYLYEEISADVLNKYKITEVYHMHNGTYTGEAENRAATIASVKETLQSNEVRIGSFTLNPANNPTYTISGRSPLVRDGHDFDTEKVADVEISNGTKVQVEVATGLDGITLDGDTLGVYVIECDANGNAVANANKIYIIKPKADKSGNQLITDQSAIDARSNLISKSGTSYKLTVTLDAALSAGLTFGKSYIFGVDGYDQNKAEVSDFGSIYGFYFVSSGSAPKIEVTSPSNGITYLGKGSDISVKGYAQADLSYPTLTIKVLDSAGLTVHTKEYKTVDIAAGIYPTTEIACSSPNNKQRIDFNYTVPKDAFSQTECAQYTLSVIATNGEKDTTIDRTIIYDVDGPNISIDSVEPEADYYEIIDGLLDTDNYENYKSKEDGSKKAGKYLNGSVLLKISIADEYDAVNVAAPEQGQDDHRPYFEVLKGGVVQSVKVNGAAPAQKIYITTPAKQNFTLDTTTFTDNDEITLKVHAWDRAGNQGVDKEANPVTVDAIKLYTVHSKTDYPVVLPNAAKTTLAFDKPEDLGDTEPTGKNKDKDNYLPASSSLALKFVDDDGIKNYKFEIGDANSNNEATLKVPVECDTLVGGAASGEGIYPSGSPKEISFNYTLPPTGGDYMCRITVTDVNDKSVSKLFWVTVTGAAPTVTVDMEPSDKKVTRNTTGITTDAKTQFTATIHISSEYGPFTITRKEPTNLNPLTYKETKLRDENNKWQSSADFTDGPFTPCATAADNYILYEVTDDNNHTGTFTVYYSVDNKKPEIKTETFDIPDTDQTEGVSYRFVVEAEDTKANGKEVASGVSKIQYVFNSTSDTSKYSEVSATGLNQVVAFASDDSFDYLTKGKKTIYVRAIDAVGNIGEWKSKEFYYDTAAPSATVTQYGDDTAGYKDVEGDIQTYKLFKLKGVASDDWGVKKITITESKDGGAATDVGAVTGTTNWTSPELPLAANRENGKPKTGSYTYKITVTDKTADVPGIAESKIKKTTTTVTVKIDTEAPTITIGSPEADSYLAGVSTVISGTVQDGTNTANQGLKNIYWAVTNSSTAPTQAVTDSTKWTKLEKTTVGTGSANWELPRSIGTGRTGSDSGTIYEGEWYLHVKAEDKAGNLSGAVSRHFYVDQGAPKISDVKKDTQSGEDLVAKAINGTYYYYNRSETNFKLSGKVLESNGLAEFTAKVDSGTPANITKPTANAEAQEWTYTVSNVTADTLKKVVIYAKDVVNREASETYNIYRDTQPPKITFTNPDSDVSGEDALTGSSYTFRANIVDEGSGVKDNKYKYMFSKTNLDTDAKIISSAEAGTGWTEYTDGQAFNKQMSIVPGTTGSDATKLCEGHWYLYFYAIDSVGNNSVKKLSFWVDLAKPKITTKIDTEPDDVKSTDYTETKTNIKTEKDFIVKYKAEDTHGLDTNYGTNGIEVVVKKNGTELTTTTSTTNVYYSIGTVSNDMYPISLKVPTNVVGDDEYTFKISAKDLAGKVTTVIRNVRLDTKGPELSITTPELDENDTSVFKDWQTSKNIKIVGTASDATGVSAVYYWLNAATAPTPPTSGTSALTESTWTGTQASPKWTKASGSSGNWTIDLSNVPDSATNKLYIAAVDENGNVCVRQDKTLKVDKVGPVLDETAIGLVGTSVLEGKTSVTLSGTISDSTSGVKGITISDNKNEASSWNATITDSNWTATINIGNENNKLKDAVHTLTIEAEDNAGNTSKQDRSVHVDTKAPTTGAFTIETAKANTIGSNDWYNESAINIKIVSVTDPVQDGYASGITAVEYTTDNKDDSTATWISMTQNTATPTTWTGKVNCNLQGANTISVRVKDAAGNVLNTNLSKTVYIDTVAPETPTSWWVNNTANFDSQMLSNKRAGVDVYIVAKDANASGTNTSSGIASVSYGSSTVTSTSKYTPTGGTELDVYKLSIAATDIENGACTIKIKDKVGKETEWSPFSFSVDTEAPKIAINTINDADKDTAGIQVNKKFDLKGTASDNRQVKQLDVCYYYDNKWTNIYSTTDADSIFNWTKEIDTVKSATCTFGNTTDMDGKEVTFCVIITDEAGNRNLDTKSGNVITDNTTVVSDTTKLIPSIAPASIADGNKKTVKIDQDSDRPIVTFTNISLAGMSSTSSVYLKGVTTLYGLISDDDGDVTSLKYSIDDGTTWNNVSVTNGSFNIPSLAQGQQTLLFQIVDKGGTTFTSSATTGPKLFDSDSTPNKIKTGDVQLYLRVDTKNPEKVDVKVKAFASKTVDPTTKAVTYNPATPYEQAPGASCIVGGKTRKKIEITAKAKDDNGIKGIKIELSDGTTTKTYYSNKAVGGETDNVKSTTTNAVYEWTTEVIDTSIFKEGEITITTTLFDNADLDNKDPSTITTDNTAPVVALNDDVCKEGAELYGVNNQAVGASIGDCEEIYWAVTGSTYTKTTTTPVEAKPTNPPVPNDPTSWTKVTGSAVNTQVVFDKKTESGEPQSQKTGEHTLILREYLKQLYDMKNTGDTDVLVDDDVNKDVYVWFKAIDACGNEGIAKRHIVVIPNGDKSKISLSYPVDKQEIKNGVPQKNIDGSPKMVNPALAGTIRVYGNAEVGTGSIQGVYLQIDPNYNGTFNESGWKTAFDTCISGKNTEYTVMKIGKKGTQDIYGIKANGTDNWNLPINGDKEFNPTGSATSRKIAIRIYGVSASGKLSDPVTQVITIDPNAPKIGGDGTVPGVMPLKLVQLTKSGNTITITNQKPYKSGEWVKGEWYIAASVYDDSGIKTISLDENDGHNKKNIVDNATKVTGVKPWNNETMEIYVEDNDCAAAIDNVTGKKNFNIYIPLPTASGSGTVNWSIEAVENTDNNNGSLENIKVNYDNTPPRFGVKEHENTNIAPSVANDNGFYHIQGYATDTEPGKLVSDIKAIAFYFVRRGSANTRVYDPMYADNYATGKHNYVAVQTGSTNTTGITYDYGMFWNTKTLASGSGKETLKLSAEDDNIHTGGLVLIDGTIYTIKSVDNAGTTVTLNTQAPETVSTAKFAYAMVIDNFDFTESIDGRSKITDKSKCGYGYYEANSSSDDGDLMQEKYNNGKWEAWVNSANIPDGPIEIHYVVMDNAQNYSVGIVGNLSKTDYEAKTTLDVAANKALNGTGASATAKTSGDTDNLVSGYYYYYDANNKAYISNNAPRIAGVKVGCDYDGAGGITAAEKTEAFYSEGNYLFSGVSTKKVNNVSNKFIASGNGKSDGSVLKVIKGAASVELEIVGGNGNLYARYSLDGTTYKEHSAITSWTKYLTDSDKNESKTESVILSGTSTRAEEYKTDDDDSKGYYNPTVLTPINFSETEIKTAITSNSDKYWFTFEVHDSTEETTLWSSSQYCELKLPLSIQVHDSVAPNTVINDLYWKNASDNSIYQDVNGTLFGHIELKKDMASMANNSTMVTTYGKDDDKVSGIVKFSGYAYDNKRLSTLNFGITKTKGSVGASDQNVMQNNNTNQAWPQTLGNPSVEFNGSWTTAGLSDEQLAQAGTRATGLDSPYCQFKVYTDEAHGAYLNENGHKVYWELTIDTARVQQPGQTSTDAYWGVGKDLYVWVRATDSSSNKTNMNPTTEVTTGTDLQKIRPNYKVDVVPYITGVTTRLASKNPADPTVYSRTAKGHYPIANDEGNITLSGFNLAPRTTTNPAGSVTVASSSITASQAYAHPTNHDGIVSINNMNNNEACGDYDTSVTGLAEATKVKHMYNRAPNTNTNLKLTDDVYFDVWDLTRSAATTAGRINEPVMRLSPQNSIIGFAFANGADTLSLPEGSTNSYQRWQKNFADYNRINFVYDENGNAHSISIGLDTQPSDHYAGRMQYINSAWGGNGTDLRNWNLTYTLALESIGSSNDLLDIERFGKPALGVSKITTTRANPTLYLAYFDSHHNQIRFRSGTITDNDGSGRNKTTKQFGQFNDSKKSDGNAIASDTSAKATSYGSHTWFEAHPDYYSLLAGGNTGNKAGEFVDLDVISGTNVTGDTVVIVWYDGTNLKYTYRFSAKGDTDDTDASSNGVTAVTTGDNQHCGWSKPENVFGEGIGEYCKIKVDALGGIHIVAYEHANANIHYAYMKSYNDYQNIKKVVVDAYSQIGKNISIDTALIARPNVQDKYNVIPYISYYADGMNGLPKLAFIPNGINPDSVSVSDGANKTTCLYTEDWEITLLPTNSAVNDDNTSVGVWKTSAGVKNTPAAPTGAIFTDTTTGTNSGKSYANGTSDVVCGYGISVGVTGFIETAQRLGVPTY